MSSLGNAKIFGGVGALFLLIGTFIPYAGPIISIVGLIFVFIAFKSISELVKDHDIFSNYLYHFIMSIISIVAIFVIILIGFGTVGQAVAKILSEKEHVLLKNYGFRPSIVAVVDRQGAAISHSGLNYNELYKEIKDIKLKEELINYLEEKKIQSEKSEIDIYKKPNPEKYFND